jgi:hypothetical protein
MTSIEQIEQEVRKDLAEANLAQWVLWDQTQFLNIGDRLFVELVLSNADWLWEACEILKKIILRSRVGSIEFLVRAKWAIKAIGEPQLATTPDGSFVAAAVVPVTLESDRVKQLVNVLITNDAETSFANILGHKPDLREIATVVVGNALRRGGQSAWNPQAKTRLEVTAQMAGELSRQMQRAA